MHERLKLVALLLLCASSASYANPLKPLQTSDMLPGCACAFGPQGQPSVTLLHWSDYGARQAVIRDAKQSFSLNLRDEKYLPEKRTPPRHGDRMVLFFASGDWQIQAVGSVIQACKPRQRQCKGTLYQARLMVQEQGGAPTQIPAWGRCRCD